MRSLIVRHHRFVFFLALYLAYLLALFGSSGVSDAGDVDHTLARLVSAMVELCLFGLLCAACARRAWQAARWQWLMLSAAIALMVGAVYLAQVYSLYVSGNFVSVLAMQNTDSAAFVESPALMVGAAALSAWVGMYWVISAIASRRPMRWHGMSERWGTWGFVAVTSGFGLLFAYSILLQNKNMRLEPGFRQAPIANMLANAYLANFAPGSVPEQPPAGEQAAGDCFRYDHDPASTRYPFQRRLAYLKPLPFAPREQAREQPNVLVLFTEGASARLIGAYGGRYARLTPNIDGLAKQSMQVQDYFNHTAATYRALSGQLSSGYAYAGGGGEGGWTQAGNASGLSRIRRQTLPLIANAAGYDSYFFAPHKTRQPIITMLRSLGFEKVFAYESIAGLLKGRVATRPGTPGLDDDSLFRGLVRFLELRERAGDEKPFFIATYNIGTHAFLGSSANDVAYGNGDNPVLDKLHNYDAALGGFLRYFYASAYAQNTILVFTSDHATYPEMPFREVAGDGLKPYFVDRIPLLVRDPFHWLPASLDAKGRNSLDLAPTVLQLAGLQSPRNSFLGTSLFEPRNFPVGIAALGSKYFMTAPDGVFAQGEIPPASRVAFHCEINVVRRFYQAEQDNRIFQPGAVVAAAADGATRHRVAPRQ